MTIEDESGAQRVFRSVSWLEEGGIDIVVDVIGRRDIKFDFIALGVEMVASTRLAAAVALHDTWLPTEAADQALTGRMMGYWLNFAASGDPNHGDAPPWPRWTPGGEAPILDREIRTEALDMQLCPLLEHP